MNQYNLTLNEYFSYVYNKIKDKEIEIVKIKSLPTDNDISVYLESLKFLMYEWAEDHKDKREYFDYIIRPIDTDWDFTSIPFEDFIEFLGKNKSKDIVKVNIEDKL